MGRSKRYNKGVEMVDRGKLYSLTEAIDLVKKIPPAKFDETVELIVMLGVKGKKEVFRITVKLPHQFGGSKKVLVFAVGEKVKEAREAGADFVGAEDLAKKIDKGWFDFDVAIATPETMPMVAKLGRILGPKGLMPNPKNETVTSDVPRVIKEIKGGRLDVRSGEHGVVRVGIGNLSHSTQQLTENCSAVFEGIARAKSLATFKGVTISSTMGPGVKVDPASIKVEQE